jgi:hypothetical protein
MINKRSPKASKKHIPKRSPYKDHSRRQTSTSNIHLQNYPVLSAELNSDVTHHIFSFVDDESLCSAMQVCKSFRDTLVQHRMNVSLAGFDSFEAFGKWHYYHAVFFSAKDNVFVTDQWLLSLARNKARYNRIARIDIRGCNRITIGGIALFVETMGSRLKGISMSHFHEREIQDTYALSKMGALLGSSPCLESLTLELNKAWIDTFSLDCLNGSTSLRELSIVLDSYKDIPAILPNLETLNLEIIDGLTEYYWEQLCFGAYPRLKRLEMTVSSHLAPHLQLGIDSLIESIENNKTLHGLKSVVIQRRVRHHAMDRGYDRGKWITSWQATVFQRSMSIEREEWQQLSTFCRSRNIYCKYPLSLDL